MGTNFYDEKYKCKHCGQDSALDPQYHIGKRSAAGLYCWDCGITLGKRGEVGVHYSESGWYDKCQKCGKSPIKESLGEGAAGRELGFNKSSYKKKKGVASCSSFRWAMTKKQYKKIKKIVDEYGRKYTKKEFEKMLEECPIQYYNMIGEEFS